MSSSSEGQLQLQLPGTGEGGATTAHGHSSTEQHPRDPPAQSGQAEMAEDTGDVGEAAPNGGAEASASSSNTTTLPVVTLLLAPAQPPAAAAPPFHFEPIERDLFENVTLKIGRQVNKGTVNPRDSLHGGRDCVWFKSKVVSRNHAEVWVKDGQVYLKDTGSSSGTFLNHMRLAPSGRESRPYPLKDNDIIQLGIDYQGRPEDIYKCVVMKVMITNRTLVQQKRKANVVMFRAALRALLNATNPYASTPVAPPPLTGGHTPTGPAAQPVDCCICLCSIAPFQALFVAPCSHCYHYKCVQPLLNQGAMFLCPLCRQVANLAANVQDDGVDEDFEDEEEVLGVALQGGSGSHGAGVAAAAGAANALEELAGPASAAAAAAAAAAGAASPGPPPASIVVSSTGALASMGTAPSVPNLASPSQPNAPLLSSAPVEPRQSSQHEQPVTTDSGSDSDRERTSFHHTLPRLSAGPSGANATTGDADLEPASPLQASELDSAVAAIGMDDRDRDRTASTSRESVNNLSALDVSNRGLAHGPQRSNTAASGNNNHLSSPETDGEDMMDVEEEDGLDEDAGEEMVDEQQVGERKEVVREDNTEGGEGGGGPMEV